MAAYKEVIRRTAPSNTLHIHDRLFVSHFENCQTFSYVGDRDVQSIDLWRAFTKTRQYGLVDLNSKQARNPPQRSVRQPSNKSHQTCCSPLLVVRISHHLYPELAFSLCPLGPTPTEIHVVWRQSKSMHGVMCTIVSLAALQITYSSSVSAGLHSIAKSVERGVG